MALGSSNTGTSFLTSLSDTVTPVGRLRRIVSWTTIRQRVNYRERAITASNFSSLVPRRVLFIARVNVAEKYCTGTCTLVGPLISHRFRLDAGSSSDVPDTLVRCDVWMPRRRCPRPRRPQYCQSKTTAPQRAVFWCISVEAHYVDRSLQKLLPPAPHEIVPLPRSHIFAPHCVYHVVENFLAHVISSSPASPEKSKTYSIKRSSKARW